MFGNPYLVLIYHLHIIVCQVSHHFVVYQLPLIGSGDISVIITIRSNLMLGSTCQPSGKLKYET